jgi:hypothetical protein
VTTLRIEADGRSVLGNLQGSGLGSDAPIATA